MAWRVAPDPTGDDGPQLAGEHDGRSMNPPATTHPAIQAVLAQRIIGIVRTADTQAAGERARALMNAGLRAVEVSLTTPRALDVVAELAAEARPGVAVGVGTVLSVAHVRAAADAGASYLVAPIFDPAVVTAARDVGLACVPAAATPTEAYAANAAGADLIKLFPASLWSPAAVKEVLAALPQLQLVPTGGVTLTGARDWITAGAAAVGIGSALSQGTPPQIEQRVTTLLHELGNA